MIPPSKSPQILYFVQGATAPKIQGKYETTPTTDISTFTFECRIEKPDDTVKIVPGVVTDGPNGLFEIPLADVFDSDTWGNGLSWAQIWVTLPSGGIEKYADYYIQVVRGL